ncbi:MAG: hypothetical protein DCC67_03880 [Planctomycetota bacterium]|nr:MAG: hypothetical protein DCC67_03880 [Planctomycetota bacterium]
MNDALAMPATTEELGALVEDLIQRLRRGESIDWDELSRLQPHLAEELAELRPALELLCQLGAASAEKPPRGLAASSPRRAEPEAPTLGDYQLIREIGRGGMGVVYEARQLSLDRRVALKVLPLAAVLDPRQQARFKTEARAAAQLHHTNIVPVFSVGCERGVHYYAMQYIEGRSLADVIAQLRASRGKRPDDATLAGVEDATAACGTGRRGAPLADGDGDPADTAAVTVVDQRNRRPGAYYRTVARLGMQAAEALHFAHEHGVLHRDVKPANLMLDAAGNVWIADFGLARLEADAGLTVTGDLVGTLRYMSPEQAGAAAGCVDRRTDVYSLGLTLYELIALESAFDGRGQRSILRQIADEEPRPLSRLDRDVPRELDTIIRKCVAKRAEERYATAQELADDFRRFLDHRPISARRSTAAQRALKWMQRHRALAAMAAASILFAAVVLGGTVWWSASRERDRQRAIALEREREAAAGLRQLRKLEYAFDMRRINASRLSHEAQLVRSILDKYAAGTPSADLRGFEWHWYASALDALQRARRETTGVHSRQVYCVAFSADGRTMATASEDARAKLWRYPSMELVQTLVGHFGDVNWAAFSPDDKTVATCSDDGTVRLWDAATGTETGSFVSNLRWARDGGQSVAYRVAFTADGRSLITMHRLHAKLWNAATGELLATIPGRGLAVARSRRVAATSPSDGTIALWDLDTARQLGSIATGAAVSLNVGQFAADDRVLVVADEAGYVTRCDLKWDGSALKPAGHRRFFAGGAAIEGLSVSTDARRAAVACRDGRIGVYDARSWQRIGGPYGHTSRAWSATLALDGDFVLTSGQDGNITRWDAACESFAAAPIGRAFASLSACYSPRGDVLAVFIPRVQWRKHGDALRLHNVETWKCEVQYSCRSGADDEHDGATDLFVDAMAISPSGRFIAVTGRKGVFVVDRRTSASAPVLAHAWPDSGPTPARAEFTEGVVGSAAFLDDRRLAFVREGVAHLADLGETTAAVPLRPPGSDEVYHCVAASPDGRQLAIGGESGSFWLYDVAQRRWKPGGRVASRAVVRMAYLAPRPWIALASEDATIAIWDVAAGRLRHQLGGHQDPVNALAWSPQQARLASSGSGETGVVRLWDVEFGQQVGALETGADCEVHELAFAPDGRSLAAFGITGTMVKAFRWQAARPAEPRGL